MLETRDILETINMIDNENLDVRTITMGISLLDCIDEDIDKACTKVYDKSVEMQKTLLKQVKTSRRNMVFRLYIKEFQLPLSVW